MDSRLKSLWGTMWGFAVTTAMQLTLQTFAEILEALRDPKVANSGSEQRQATRFEIQTKVMAAPISGGRVGRAYFALTRDVSNRGIGLLQSLPMKHGDEFLVRLPRTCSRPPFVFVCGVMFAGALADGLTGIGAQFNAIATQEQARALEPGQQEQKRIQNSVLA